MSRTIITAAEARARVEAVCSPIYPWAPMARTYACLSKNDVLRTLRGDVATARHEHGLGKGMRGWDCEVRGMQTWLVSQTVHAIYGNGKAERAGVIVAVLPRAANATEGHVINAAFTRDGILWFDSQFFDYGYEPGEHIRAAGVDAPASILQIWG